MQESRENIKTRMLRNASRIWGYSETESENNFDPLVSMLLTACAAELEKVSGEIHASRARVLSRLVQLLSPDALTGSLPAHSVACARPVENRMMLHEDVQFYQRRRAGNVVDSEEVAWKDLFFSPTASFPIAKASIRFMAAGNTLYRITQHTNKEILAHTDRGKELPANSLWLAVDEPGISLKDCLFYFDLRNEAGRQLFYHQLPKATWFWNDQPMEHSAGYGDRVISGEHLDLSTVLNREVDPMGKIKKSINAFYKSQFVTLLDPGDLSAGMDDQVLSAMISDCFSAASLQKMGKTPLRWICLDFPQTVPTRLLQDVVCVLNCFPVVNRQLHELTFRLQEVLNILPLQTEDLFLDLEEISTDEGRLLNVRNFQETGGEGDYAMLMRNGGVGRFDERDAGGIVDYLLQLLRDESAAFSSLGNDFMGGEVKQLQQIMNKLEQRLFSVNLQREQTPYLVIRNNARSSWKNIFVKYWSTAGNEGNNIKAGTAIRLYKGGGLENASATLVTTTVGGRNRLGNNDSVLAYKSALLSRDRLVTEEDIKAFCHFQLGERVVKVAVEKGIMIHPDQSQGFVKTVDVKISIHDKAFEDMLEKGEVIFWKENLTLQLEEKSAALLPYRVFIDKAA
jgi:hypothetical protein